ncbi:MAG: DUF488 domain-containing protein [Candidatus Paceibacterota bacterium]
MIKIFSFGHSRRAYSEFLQKLRDNQIDILVDVRSFPRSRFCPQFNQKALSEELAKADITYLFKGSNLGGLGENTAYEETIDELVETVNTGKKVCVMCSEGDFKKCHRFSVLTPSFEARGVSVEHIE